MRRWAGWAGLASSIVLPAVMGALTIAQRHFLRDVGWSPVHRTPTEWPSLLALGPNGEWMVVAFAGSAVVGAALARAVWSDAEVAKRRLVGTFLLLASIGQVGVAFKADLPDDPTQSWHAAIHNGLYPLIPLGLVASAVTVACTRAEDCPGQRLRQHARLLAPLMVMTFACTNIDPVAQLARYFAFSTLLIWLGMVSRAVLERTRAQVSATTPTRR